MSDAEPPIWDVLDGETREIATRTVMRNAHVSRQKAEDTVLDAVVRIAPSGCHYQNVRSFLITTALNLIRSERRREGGRRQYCAIAYSTAHPVAEVSDRLTAREDEPLSAMIGEEEAQQRKAALKKALDQLSEPDRFLLTAYYFERRSLIAMDDEQGERRGTAKLRLHRVRERLRRLARSELDEVDRAR